MTRSIVESTDGTVLLDEMINEDNIDEFDKKLEKFIDRELVSMKFSFVPGIKVGDIDDLGDLEAEQCTAVKIVIKST